MADNYSEISVEKPSAERAVAKQMGISGFSEINSNSEQLKVARMPISES
jgi:hypothetical protein